MLLHLQITARQREHPSCQTLQPPRGEKKPSFVSGGGVGGHLGLLAASDPLSCPFSRKRSPPMGGAPSPSSLSLPPSTGFPLQAPGAPSPYLSSLPEPSPLRPKREKRPRLPRKLKMTVGPPDCPVGGPLTFPSRGSAAGVGATLAPLPPPKMPPPTILSAVPRQMFSDAGSGDDALDGDDDLVIDIPE
ncbi:INO80 complex subunit E [Phyllostomus discolor]|uniref:INO80 complex subunit E n=1 Tax=Phyllostomus discolor TaxID=89673 RepID=A0A834B7Q3_9CHIR|nr:INO80 complex subunit E [Phyllostomus discolor]